MNSTARGPSSVDHSLLSDFLFFIPFSLIIIFIIALTRDVPTHSLKKLTKINPLASRILYFYSSGLVPPIRGGVGWRQARVHGHAPANE